MFCPNCGREVRSGARFCENCGTSVEASVQETAAPAFQAPGYAFGGAVRQGIPAPGFSDRVNDPEILAYTAKNRGLARKIGFVVALLPLLGFFVYALVTGKMELKEAALTGAAVSAVFFLVQLISFRRERAENSYEGVVTDKKWRTRTRSKGDDSYRETEYITLVQTTDGKKKKIVEHDGSRVVAYELLSVGDRFRYHPQFAFPYELYDKAKGPGLYCVGCGTLNALESDRCKKCGLPLLK